MITLYTFGPAFGLPDPSPFVMKAEVLLKMAGLPYRTDTTGFRKAPKGKLPYVEDSGEIIPDSTFIRFHLEKKYGIDFDRSLDQEQRAIAWAFEKLAEDHLYWAIVEARWSDEANFNKGPRKFFAAVPAPLRPFVIAIVRRQVRKNLHGHGIGRHSRPEIVTLATRGIDVPSRHICNRSRSSWAPSHPGSMQRSLPLWPDFYARASKRRYGPRPSGTKTSGAMSGA